MSFANQGGKNQKFRMPRQNLILASNLSVTTMDWDVYMETVGHQTSVLVKLDGRVLIAIFVFRCQDVIMDLARMLLNATVMKDGKEHIVTFPAAITAPMANASLPMNVSAIMDGLVRRVTPANLWQDVFMAAVWIILTPVFVRVVGRDIFVTSLTAHWIVITDSAMLQVLPILPTSVSATLDGEARDVTSAAPTGDAQIRVMMLVTVPMNASVSRQRMTHWVCATIQF